LVDETPEVISDSKRVGVAIEGVEVEGVTIGASPYCAEIL